MASGNVHISWSKISKLRPNLGKTVQGAKIIIQMIT